MSKTPSDTSFASKIFSLLSSPTPSQKCSKILSSLPSPPAKFPLFMIFQSVLERIKSRLTDQKDLRNHQYSHFGEIIQWFLTNLFHTEGDIIEILKGDLDTQEILQRLISTKDKVLNFYAANGFLHESGMPKEVADLTTNFYERLISEVLAHISLDDILNEEQISESAWYSKEDLDVFSKMFYSAEIFQTTKREILGLQNDNTTKLMTLARLIENSVDFERILDIDTLPKLLPYIGSRREDTKTSTSAAEEGFLENFSKEKIIRSVVCGKLLHKNYSKKDAKVLFDILKTLVKPDTVSPYLTKALEIWETKRLINIGSINQLEYLTYLVRHLILFSMKLDRSQVDSIRIGINTRLDTKRKECVLHANIIWDTFTHINSIENSILTPDQIEEFDMIQEKPVPVKMNKMKQEVESKDTTEETKEFYDSNDSDNDSDFAPFEMEEDDGSDVISVSRPTHLYDLYLGLQSDSLERFHLALEVSEELITKNLPNLESMIPDLIEILFRLENKFNKDDFEKLKKGAIKACLFIKPATSAPIFFQRLGYREASLGQKMGLLSLLEEVVKELANTEEQERTFSEKSASDEDPSHDFRSFFETPSEEDALSEASQKINERILENTTFKKSYEISKRKGVVKKNYFLTLSHKFLYPLLSLPVYSDTYMTFLDQHDLALTYLHCLSTVLFYSMNSHQFESFAKETLEMLPVYMELNETSIRKILLEIFTTLILGTKQFMLQDLKEKYNEVYKWVTNIREDDGDLHLKTTCDKLLQILSTLQDS
ncbi:unnamed protein product [Moneuplotes crassus]|uniref:Telomere length regulation protein conserved domain-containing protein n=1 Tax=Euplotes crassus TaxID=5936 RepID=A0AAD2D8Y4_EUPCR|nr:unnamed protein product [Moneuplotes crassus]